MVFVPRNTSIIVVSGRVVCTGRARERASKRREPVRWLEVDPAIASKVDLRPQVCIDSPDGPFSMLGIVLAIGVAIYYPRRHAQQARHDGHRCSKVFTQPL